MFNITKSILAAYLVESNIGDENQQPQQNPDQMQMPMGDPAATQQNDPNGMTPDGGQSVDPTVALAASAAELSSQAQMEIQSAQQMKDQANQLLQQAQMIREKAMNARAKLDEQDQQAKGMEAQAQETLQNSESSIRAATTKHRILAGIQGAVNAPYSPEGE